MKVILIDPKAKSITETNIGKSLQDIYKAMECEMIEAPLNYPNGDTMYCDEEAWLHFKEEEDAGFMFHDWNYPILGKSIIVGTNNEGDSVDCKSSVEDFKNVIWVSAFEMSVFGTEIGLI